MSVKSGSLYSTIPRLERIPFLIHGFGARLWKEDDYKNRPEWKDFKLVLLNQIHSNIIQVIDNVPEEKLKGDAAITGLPFLLLIIKTADCLPALIVDEPQKVIAAVHCGWRGTSKRVIKKVIQNMKNHYGSDPALLLVALGPCIGRECYEVGEDVYKSFKQEGLSTEFFRNHPLRRQKYLFDLKGANLSQMVSEGVEEKNIFSVEICTHCHESLPSFRRDKDKAGRTLSFIGMSS
ncbi:MAG: peptidoglycan editing factor PgeF [Candidatus Aminicenantes bacterium]|nr:peptidoglycan editing factor PgeF [Candidatus Aminicenantes bacterium]